MNTALSGVCNVVSDQTAPRWTPLRLALSCGYAEQVWLMQASGIVGRTSFRSTKHHRPNQPFNRSAQRRRRWLPVALRAPAPG